MAQAAHRSTQRDACGFLDTNKVTKLISGKCVSHAEIREGEGLAIVFEDGSALEISRLGTGLAAEFASNSCFECPAAVRPTSRQREYLEFITKYMDRFGIAPAESDIQRHFLVSAPSVNSMMQTLERQGFIKRQPGMPRSIRMVEATECAICGGTHHLKSANARDTTHR